MMMRLKRLSFTFVLLSLSLAGMNVANAVSDTILPGSLAASSKFADNYCHDPETQKADGECEVDTPAIRRDHSKLLRDKRDKTMRLGVRTPDFSIKECVACHAAKDETGKFVPITDKGQFCAVCHERVAAKPDCFECHRTTPESGPRSASKSN